MFEAPFTKVFQSLWATPVSFIFSKEAELFEEKDVMRGRIDEDIGVEKEKFSIMALFTQLFHLVQ